MHNPNYRSMVIVIMLAGILSACGDHKDTKASQVLVRVDDSEITVHQVNQALQQLRVPQAQQKQATKQLLPSLVDRQLLENAALKEKLDRNPDVLQSIEQAKAQILAQAYMQKIVAKVVKPTDAEVTSYFKAHPEYFSQRKAFQLEEITMARSDFTDEAKTMANAAKSLDDVSNWLNKNHLRFAKASAERSSTDLPPDLVKQLLGMQVGNLIVVAASDRVMIAELKSVKDAPIAEAQAKPQIEQFLLNKKRKEIGEAEMAKLRTTAKIDYIDKSFAPEQPVSKTAETTDKKTIPQSTPEAKPAEENHIDRGVAGLK